VTVYLRNCDVRRTAAVPVAPGWARLLYPGVTSRVPAQTVALPVVQRLLAAERLRVITEVSRAPDAAELLRRDMAAAIAAAEARELAALVARQVRQHGAAEAPRRPYVRRQRPEQRKRRDDEWPAELIVWLKARWAEGATGAAIAAELGVTPGAVIAKAKRLGLAGRRRLRSDSRAPERRQAVAAV
jgi:GcrA cell cycle regulator